MSAPVIQSEIAGGLHGGLAAGDPELAVDRLAVGLHRVERHVQLTGDLPLRQLRRQVGQDRQLTVGDEVSLHGRIVTARDAAHKHMIEKKPQSLAKLLRGSLIYGSPSAFRTTSFTRRLTGWKRFLSRRHNGEANRHEPEERT